MSKILSFLKNETITYDTYMARCKWAVLATVVLYFTYASNLFSRNAVFMLTIFLAYALSILFATYNLYRAVMAGIGVYNLKGLLKVIKKLIDKI